MPWFPRSRTLTLPRSWMRDFVHFGMKSHVVGGSRVFNIKPVALARRAQKPPISWSAILLRALALMEQRWPQLRQSYLPYPWPRIYQHPHAVATIVIEREWCGEHAVFFGRIKAPEQRSLREIDNVVRKLKTAPVESIRDYRRIIGNARLPFPLRRLLWWIGLYWSGRRRSSYFGTYALNSIPARGTEVSQSTTPLAVAFFHAPVEPSGNTKVQVFFDHRVLDGRTMHRILCDLETTLNRDIVAELRGAGSQAECGEPLPRAHGA